MSRVCAECGDAFEPARAHHRLCWPCWHLLQGDGSSSDRPPSLASLLDAATLRAAVALAHPDRHPPERQEQATRVTQALLDALRAVRDADGAPA